MGQEKGRKELEKMVRSFFELSGANTNIIHREAPDSHATILELGLSSRMITTTRGSVDSSATLSPIPHSGTTAYNPKLL